MCSPKCGVPQQTTTVLSHSRRCTNAPTTHICKPVLQPTRIHPDLPRHARSPRPPASRLPSPLYHRQRSAATTIPSARLFRITDDSAGWRICRGTSVAYEGSEQWLDRRTANAGASVEQPPTVHAALQNASKKGHPNRSQDPHRLRATQSLLKPHSRCSLPPTACNHVPPAMPTHLQPLPLHPCPRPPHPTRPKGRQCGTAGP